MRESKNKFRKIKETNNKQEEKTTSHLFKSLKW